MDRDEARGLVNSWVAAHGEGQQGAQGVYNAFVAELLGLVPEDGLGGVAWRDEAPVIVAVAGASLLVISATSEGQAEAIFSCLRVPLTEQISVQLHSELKAERTRLLRRRTWTFGQPADGGVEITTTEFIRAQFNADQGPSPGERVARAGASAVGWKVPEQDEGLAEY